MHRAHDTYSAVALSAVRRNPNIPVVSKTKEKTMAYISARPIAADDPLVYFSALNVAKLAAPAPAKQHPAEQALDVMYGYYSAD